MIDHFGAPWTAPDRYEPRPDARRFETWENNYAARLGLGVAIDYALEIGLGEIETRCQALATQLRSALARIDGVTIHDLGPRPAAIVSFSLAGHDAGAVYRRLSEAGINVSTSRPASALLDFLARGLPTIVRASPHYYNTAEEIEALAATIRAMAGSRRA